MKKYAIWLAVVLLVLAAGCVFSFFYYFGSHDTRALAEFPAAYQEYDQAIAAYSVAVTAPEPASPPAADELEGKASAALARLKASASVRISSLTRNDAELMQLMGEVGELSGREFDTLKAYRSAAAKAADRGALAQMLAGLSDQRRADFSRFSELAR